MRRFKDNFGKFIGMTACRPRYRISLTQERLKERNFKLMIALEWLTSTTLPWDSGCFKLILLNLFPMSVDFFLVHASEAVVFLCVYDIRFMNFHWHACWMFIYPICRQKMLSYSSLLTCYVHPKRQKELVVSVLVCHVLFLWKLREICSFVCVIISCGSFRSFGRFRA